MRAAVLKARKSYELEQLADSFAAPCATQTKRNVSSNIKVRKKCAFLRDISNRAALRRHRYAAVENRATVNADNSAIGAQETCDSSKQRGLSAATGTEDGNERTCRDLHGHIA